MFSSLFLLLLTLCVSCIKGLKLSAIENIPSSELSGLHDLFNSTSGPNWLWKGESGHWNFTVANPAPCEPSDVWQGISCTVVDGQYRVESIELSAYNLTGTIPNSIGDFNLLLVLDLSYNHLFGTISSTIGSLNQLSYLQLYENRLTGAIPSSLCSLSALTDVYLEVNKLESSIPSCIGNLSALLYFYVSDNELTGSFPESVGNWARIIEFVVYNNAFTGPLPSTIGNWTDLEYFSVYQNKFSKAIPAEVGRLTKMTIFAVQNNRLTGTLPVEITSCVRLQELNLNNNNLLGPLPDTMGDLQRLTSLGLQHNFDFSGTIPFSMANITGLTSLVIDDTQMTGSLPPIPMLQMTEFLLNDNLFNGSLPDTLSTVPKLTDFYLYNYFSGTLPELEAPWLQNLLWYGNEFHGPIPDSYYDFNDLEILALGSNHLTGTISTSIGNLKHCETLSLFDNYLDGPVPEVFDALRHSLSSLFLYGNSLTGSFPSSLCNDTKLIEIYLDYNNFDGSIECNLNLLTSLETLSLDLNDFTGLLPEIVQPNFQFLAVEKNHLEGPILNSMTVLPYLNAINVGNNLFSGTIPASFSANILIYLELYSNLFTGSLPYLGYQKYLEIFVVYDNKFTGNLNNVFNASNQPVLIVIDISLNQLTGSLPADIFELPALSVFQANGNCIDGSIPTEVCNAKLLTGLVLDGMMTASECQNRFFPFDNTYRLRENFKNGIPSCIFGMTYLQTLHLAGNGLTGSIGEDISIGQDLTDLALSHNDLTGSIPVQLQTRIWRNFDLSYNKFNGELSSSFVQPVGNSTVSLEVNRLSGRVPVSLQLASSINMLNGNLFSCDLDRSNLPQSDPNYSTYQCGSNSFNASMFLVTALLGTFLMISLVLFCISRKYVNNSSFLSLIQMIESWFAIYCTESDLEKSSKNSNFVTFHKDMAAIRKCGLYIALVLVVVLLAVYITLSQLFNTYSNSYGWETSALYLSGWTASITLLCVWTVFGILIGFLFYYVLPAKSEERVAVSTVVDYSFWKMMLSKTPYLHCRNICFAAWLLLINGVAVTGVNVGYVYVNHHENAGIIFVVQICVVFFKLVWNGIVVKRSVCNMIKSSEDHNVGDVLYSRVQLLSLIVVFNNLVAPFIATAIVSSNCFYNVFVAAPTVATTFEGTKCGITNGDNPLNPYYECYLDADLTVTSSFVLPFIYSYQCASTFVATYTDVYVYMFLLVGFVMPVYQILTKIFLTVKFAERNLFIDLVYKTLPKLLRPTSNHGGAECDSETKSLKKSSLPKLSIFMVFY